MGFFKQSFESLIHFPAAPILAQPGIILISVLRVAFLLVIRPCLRLAQRSHRMLKLCIVFIVSRRRLRRLIINWYLRSLRRRGSSWLRGADLYADLYRDRPGRDAVADERRSGTDRRDRLIIRSFRGGENRPRRFSLLGREKERL